MIRSPDKASLYTLMSAVWAQLGLRVVTGSMLSLLLLLGPQARLQQSLQAKSPWGVPCLFAWGSVLPLAAEERGVHPFDSRWKRKGLAKVSELGGFLHNATRPLVTCEAGKTSSAATLDDKTQRQLAPTMLFVFNA